VLAYTNIGSDYNNLPVCGIFAITVVSGKEFREVFEHHKTFFHKGSRWKGRTRWEHLLGHLHDYDIEYEEMELTKRVALKKFEEKLGPDTVYLLRLGNHFVVYYNGEYIDQHGVHTACFSNKQVTHAAKL
jgi:hypothetical protein